MCSKTLKKASGTLANFDFKIPIYLLKKPV